MTCLSDTSQAAIDHEQEEFLFWELLEAAIAQSTEMLIVCLS